MARYLKGRNPLLLEESRAKAKGFKLIAGVDEAGRGPLAGPVVAASVILKSSDFTVRIDDSKKLSAQAREKAYQQILKKSIIGIGIIPEALIDKINIYRATILAMEKAVLDLEKRPDFIIIDGNLRLKIRIKQQSIIKGDQKSLSIACASIVAKVTRDRLLRFYDILFPDYGFGSHKGYGTRSHIRILKEKGFSPIHRRTFKVRG